MMSNALERGGVMILECACQLLKRLELIAVENQANFSQMIKFVLSANTVTRKF